MTADGLTKGAVDRGLLLHKLMDGTMEIVHPAEEWHPRRYQEQTHAAEQSQVFFVPNKHRNVHDSVISKTLLVPIAQVSVATSM